MQLFSQRATALDEEGLVDGLVRHLHLRIIRIAHKELTMPRSVLVTTLP